ncbi:MAG: hypothetical protein IV107_16460 [Paucibacter sp.]|nr:hypothetical protein [Roseateles sp.]
MSTLKPFFVRLTYTAVVMAEDCRAAEVESEGIMSRIVGDSANAAEVEAVELTSIAQLTGLDPAWSAACCAYLGDEPTIGNILPERAVPERCTRTADLFAGQGGAT